MADAPPPIELPVWQPAPFEPGIVEAGGRRYALVWDDAWLYAYPKKPDREQTRALPEGRVDPMTSASPYRIVAHWSTAWREVERDPADPYPHCHSGAPPARSYKRQYYVNEADLLPLTGAPVDLRFPDGTGLRLSAGVALSPEGEAWRVRVGGLDWVSTLPEGSVDYAYSPSTPFPEAPATALLQPTPDGVLGTVNGAPVRVDPDSAWALAGLDHGLATVRSACAELTLQVDPARVSFPGRQPITGKPR